MSCHTPGLPSCRLNQLVETYLLSLSGHDAGVLPTGRRAGARKLLQPRVHHAAYCVPSSGYQGGEFMSFSPGLFVELQQYSINSTI